MPTNIKTQLITPYGDSLVDLIPSDAERARLIEHALTLPFIKMSMRNLCDLELIANGGFSPLRTFMDQADYQRVLEEMRLADGTLWPLPITLTANPSELPKTAEIGLRSANNELIATMEVQEVFPWSYETEARLAYGSLDARHPMVSEMVQWGKVCISGPLKVISLPKYYDMVELRLTPAEVRRRLEVMGHANVVAFQTRNPMHRVHEELTKRAADSVGGSLLIHPVVGMTKPGDVDHFTRVRIYRALVDLHYDHSKTLLSLLNLAMRMAGPREALLHAILRRNHGANHLIVGRDHAGPGQDSNGKPFYGPYEAQEILQGHQAELGVTMIPFQELVYAPDEERYIEVGAVPDGVRTVNISGTQVRDDYLDKGRLLPAWFTRPEAAEILRETYPPKHRQGFCIWFTGLSGAGKTATAEVLTTLLLERGRGATVLDGDVIRTHLSKGLGFSKEDRDVNILRIGFVAGEIVHHRGVVICAAISPYRAARNEARRMVGDDNFVMVFVDTPIEICEERDTKGLYAKARRGEITGFTGVDDPYEPPIDPDITLHTVVSTPEENARQIIAYLERAGFLLTRT